MVTKRRKRQAKARSDVERRVQTRIRDLRTGGGLTLAALAERAGLSVDALARIESGERSPTLNTVAALAGALGVPVASLIDEPPPSYSAPTLRLARLVEEQGPDVRTAVLELARLFIKTVHRPAK